VQYFAKLLTLPSQERPLFILFDAIDQLSEEDGPAGLSWLPTKTSKHVKIILTTLQDQKYRVYPVLCSMYGSSSSNLVQVINVLQFLVFLYTPHFCKGMFCMTF